MPKVEKIEDSIATSMPPLRVTRRQKSPSLRVKCGCCDEAVVIYFPEEPMNNPHMDTLEINGVMGTIDQRKQILLPLLGVKE